MLHIKLGTKLMYLVLKDWALSADVIGLKESRALYDLIKDVTGEEIALVDADGLIREPEKVLRKCCEMVGCKFKEEMLEWKLLKR